VFTETGELSETGELTGEEVTVLATADETVGEAETFSDDPDD
jgi:hypothetical protein